MAPTHASRGQSDVVIRKLLNNWLDRFERIGGPRFARRPKRAGDAQAHEGASVHQRGPASMMEVAPPRDASVSSTVTMKEICGILTPQQLPPKQPTVD